LIPQTLRIFLGFGFFIPHHRFSVILNYAYELETDLGHKRVNGMTTESMPKSPSLTIWQFPLVSLPVFVVYLATLNPALFRNDSPETITACFTLGVPHPPSYPLYTLLGHLFGLHLVGNPAFTINLFS